MILTDYPPKLVVGMIYYTVCELTIKSDIIFSASRVIPKHTLVQIKRRAHKSTGLEYYLVYFKLSNGIISDTIIRRRDLKYYSHANDKLWSDYANYHQDLQNKLLLQNT